MRKEVKIPTPHHPHKYTIPDSVAIPSISDPELQQLTISFEYYNEKLCQIDVLEKSAYKKFLKHIKKLGMTNEKNLRSTEFSLKPVSRGNEYGQLFNKLDEDIDMMYEFKGGSTCRLFFFTLLNKLYIVSFRAKHFETNKNWK